MQAIAGFKSDFIKDLEAKYFVNGSHLADKLNMNERRNITFHNLAQFMWMYDRVPDRRSAPTRKELHDWLDDGEEPSENLVKKTKGVLKYFTSIAKDERYMQRFRREQAYAPVEFIFSAMLIAMHKDSLSKEEISRGLGLLRREVRLMFPGQIRTNKACCALMFAFVEDLTVVKMDAKEEELLAIEKFKAEEGKRQREERRKAKHPEGSGDEQMEVDSPEPPPQQAPTPRKRKRVESKSPTKPKSKHT